jgi:hypothetical protein
MKLVGTASCHRGAPLAPLTAPLCCAQEVAREIKESFCVVSHVPLRYVSPGVMTEQGVCHRLRCNVLGDALRVIYV